MSRTIAILVALVSVGLLVAMTLTEQALIPHGWIAHAMLEIGFSVTTIGYCGYATLHAAQRVQDPVDRTGWMLMTLGLNVLGSCLYYCTKYQGFRKLGQGGLIRRSTGGAQGLTEFSESEKAAASIEAAGRQRRP